LKLSQIITNKSVSSTSRTFQRFDEKGLVLSEIKERGGLIYFECRKERGYARYS
jgi:hypothetical protein